MDHPFFDTIAFPWDHPLAIKLHKALHQAITNPSNIENRCQKCLGSIQLNKSATPDEVWQEALNKLTTARQLQKLCEDLLADSSVASIHSILLEVINSPNRLTARPDTVHQTVRPRISANQTENTLNGSSGHYVVVLSAVVSDVNRVRAQAILEHLRSITEDSELTLVRIEPGSVRLILRGSRDGYEKLKSAERSLLFNQLGFEVLDVIWIGIDHTPKSTHRFEVAISFAGDNKRDKVREIADLLRTELGDGNVFFDEWFEAEIAGHDASDYFQNVYGKQTQLVVVCVCAAYNEKPWTQDEWRAIKAFERGLRDVNSGNLKRLRLLPIRFGDGEVDGLFSTAIVPDVRDRTAMQIAKLILERLRLSKGGSPTAGQSAKSETDTELLVAASQPYDPIESREWYVDSRKRLQGLAEEILSECDVARKFILQCNDMAETTDASGLAKSIFEAKYPMSYLRRCLRQNAKKRKLTDEQRKELAACLYRLVDYVAPVCFTVDDLHSLEPHVSRLEGNFARVSTTAKSVAVSMVAGIKGVSADLNNYSKWEQFQLDKLPDSREIVSHLPPAPEPGRRPSNSENPIAAFVAVLAIAINPEQPTPEYVQAKLADLAEYDKVFFVVLFHTLPSNSYLETLHETFPQLVLLVADQRPRQDDASPAADISLDLHIRDLRAEFGPQQSGSDPA